jgi:serine/threonine-protein kinase PRP4
MAAVQAREARGAGATALQDTYDDSEGYYRIRPGETIGLDARYVVLSTGGKGVFSSVLFARDELAVEAEAAAPTDDASTLAAVAAGMVSTAASPVAVGSSGALVKQHAALARGSRSRVAVKVIRSNDTMRRAGQAEMDILRALATADPVGKYHTIRLLDTFEHRGHMCLVFESMAANLKEVQTRFGKGVGLALRAVREYATQLLLSLALLAKLRIIHADIKPHNVLASERFNVVKLADFGSAFREDDPENVPTPYLVSRFYRAPEVILGTRHSPALDMWSLAACLVELYTGSPLFPGEDNNDMLWRMQCLRGRFPHRMIRRHVAASVATGAEQHFEGDTLRFRRHVVDAVSKAPKVTLLDVTEPTESLSGRLAAKRAEGDDRRSIAAFADMLDKMLSLDPERRLTPTGALAHPFIAEAKTSRGS